MLLTLIVYVQAKFMLTQPVCKCAIICTSTHVRNCSISYVFRNNSKFSKFPKYKITKRIYKVNMYTHDWIHVKKLAY